MIPVPAAWGTTRDMIVGALFVLLMIWGIAAPLFLIIVLWRSRQVASQAGSNPVPCTTSPRREQIPGSNAV